MEPSPHDSIHSLNKAKSLGNSKTGYSRTSITFPHAYSGNSNQIYRKLNSLPCSTKTCFHSWDSDSFYIQMLKTEPWSSPWLFFLCLALPISYESPLVFPGVLKTCQLLFIPPSYPSIGRHYFPPGRGSVSQLPVSPHIIWSPQGNMFRLMQHNSVTFHGLQEKVQAHGLDWVLNPGASACSVTSYCAYLSHSHVFYLLEEAMLFFFFSLFFFFTTCHSHSWNCFALPLPFNNTCELFVWVSPLHESLP